MSSQGEKYGIDLLAFVTVGSESKLYFFLKMHVMRNLQQSSHRSDYFGFFIKRDPGFVYNRKNSLLFCKVQRRGKLISARLSTLLEPSEQTFEAQLLEARASLFVSYTFYHYILHNSRICKA